MASGQTIIEYGDITLYNVTTRRFHQAPEWNDSRHETQFTRTQIQIGGIVHGRTRSTGEISAYGPLTFDRTGAGDAALAHREIRAGLMKPRKAFRMRIGCDAAGNGGTVLLEANPFERSRNGDEEEANEEDQEKNDSPTGYDLDGGPKCMDLDVTHVAAGNLFRINATFEVCLRECDPGGASTENDGSRTTINPIRSLTWNVEDDIDQSFLTTRTYTGRLIANSPLIRVNAFRNYVVPPVLPGMMRRRLRFQVAADRMSLDFAIVDQEIHFSPPKPATSWQFEHTVDTGDAVARVGTVNISLNGDRDTSHKELINLAMRIIEAKLFPPVVKQDNDTGIILDYLSITDYYTDSISGIRASARSRYVGLEFAFEKKLTSLNLGRPLDGNYPGLDEPDYDSRQSRGARPGDELETEGAVTRLGTIEATFRDACHPQKKFGDFLGQPKYDPCSLAGGCSENEPSQNDPNYDVDYSVETVQSIPGDPPEWVSPNHSAAMFTAWRMESLYDTNEGVIALPVASTAPPTAPRRPIRGAADEQQSQQPDTVKFVRLHQPIATRTVRVDGERAGKWPDFPKQARHTDENGITYTPLRTKILAQTIDRTADGKELYRGRVEYLQGLSRAPSPGEQLAIGYNPWDILGIQSLPLLDETDTGSRSA